MNNEDKIKILMSDNHGIYIPKLFAENFDTKLWNADLDDVAILLAGPDHDHYWDAWDDVLNNAWIDWRGHRWTLYQDGDLFAVRSDFDWEEWQCA